MFKSRQSTERQYTVGMCVTRAENAPRQRGTPVTNSCYGIFLASLHVSSRCETVNSRSFHDAL